MDALLKNEKARMSNVEGMTKHELFVGCFCETPWHLTQTPYNCHSDLIRHSTSGLRHSLPMPYRYLEEIGTADIAFEASGRDLAELFSDAADATTNVMIENIEAIQPRETRQIELSNDKLDMLLFDLLQELIFLKDAERLLLRMRKVQITERDENYFVKATAEGEPLDAERHHQRADVKAVTLHDFSVEQTEGGWRARVLLDI
jgi:SHS2 domain-containing protein